MTPSGGNPGLYLHLPFCSSICPYCDFYVLTGDRQRRRDFVELLLREISFCAESPWPGDLVTPPDQPFDSIYFGGGTPSILEPEDLDSILAALDSTLPIAHRPWMGMEANPEDVEPRKLAAWKESGCQFLSLGVQSFDSRNLRFLGRHHDADRSRESTELACTSDIETISLDLIYGLPGQSSRDWRIELETALEFEPDHLSCYQLTIEPGTPFGSRNLRGQLAELPSEAQADLFYLTHRLLRDRGFEAYEVSNFASAAHHRSLHNSKYWQHVPYLGLGPSAHSFASPLRWWNTRRMKPYEARIHSGERPIENSELLDTSQLCLEHLMLGLRTPSGVSFDDLPGDLGPQVWMANREWIEQLVVDGFARLGERSIIPTLKGLATAEALAQRFTLPGEPPANPAGIC